MPQLRGLLITLLFVETVAEKKYCWYFEGDYPVYFVLLLIIGILCCCSTGYFIRRRVHPYPPPDRPEFNVAFTRQPIISPGLHQAGFHNYGDSETAVISTVYQVQTHPGHVTAVYSAVPSHYRQPPPSYEQRLKLKQENILHFFTTSTSLNH
ncbi:vesicular, overexpressed in cancer, prosurvival protein 1 isoform X5 [Carassius gibelio]|uniref:vesicular, overexpressed in cancer, prosurvival protein 1 isoform X5 n=1 Tax=Carassius gibelio TaxID=101364 RepID=UPI0022789555|nr:vesicular, overexpressed in cancer, prosurvival protein 1 isoform X5 [Carassius gibelio]